ncbi:MAG: hypothetical protein ABSG11_21120 [Candidatus Korobacteraceae bacterium]
MGRFGKVPFIILVVTSPLLSSHRMRAALALVLAGLLGTGGCGSSGSTSSQGGSGSSPVISDASSFVAHPLPVSPADQGGIINLGLAKRARPKDTKVTTASSSNTGFVHWFYLVNGQGIPKGVINTTTPPVNWTPNVLTVNGTAPGGAPNPNGGTGVGIATMNPVSNGSQLWKAVAATTSGYVYLQSADSIITNNAQGFTSTTNNTNWPSMLLGYGATNAQLDLGNTSYNSAAIYWNQSGSPTGDNSAFQSWQYAACDNNFTEQCGQIVNLGNGTQLLNETSAPANQWYAYPSYYAEQVIQQPNSEPPFPANSDQGELAAYELLSCLTLTPASCASVTPPPQTTCTLEGTEYNGVRCEYINASATATLSTCASIAATYPNPGSTPGNLTSPDGGQIPAGTSISDSDWTTVATQLQEECQYAADIQDAFSNYNTIVNNVFVNTKPELPQLAIDLGLSQSQSVSAVPIDILEGALYTILCATGDPGLGVVANLMSAGVNTALAADSSSSLKSPLAAEVQDLYAQLSSQFALLTQQSANGEQAILEDWGRLSLLGPLALQSGYNGLAIETANGNLGKIEQQVARGYALSVMQQLMPVSNYALMWSAAGTSSTPPSPWVKTPTSDQYSYLTFGAFPPSNYNLGWFAYGTQYPSQTVMQTDILDNGGNPFELFNGINGWKAVKLGGGPNMDCDTTVVTLFNATPTDLSVTVTPQQGEFAASGYNFNGNGSEVNGDESAATFELRPYGYLPLYVASNGSGGRDLTMVVTLSDGSNQVASFTFGNDGCTQDSFNVWNTTSTDNYGFSPSGYPNTRWGSLSAGNPNALWWTITNTSLTPQ